MNFLVAAFIQLRLGAPIELFDPQNFIAFGIVIFYWLILPIYRIHHVRLARQEDNVLRRQ